MKNLQGEVEQCIDGLVEKLQRAVGEVAIEALQQRLVHQKKARARRRSGSTHRGPTEIEALMQRLYEAICAQPGERMVELSKAIG